MLSLSLRSGLLNFASVAMALNDLGYRALGIRIDSGDLAYLSKVARESFVSISKAFDVEWFASLTVVASNDINEDTILSLNDQGHSIDVFGIGTHLGTDLTFLGGGGKDGPIETQKWGLVTQIKIFKVNCF